MPSKFHARMMFMAPNAEREEEVAAIYQKDINDPRPSKWPHWMLFPVTPLQEKCESPQRIGPVFDERISPC